MHSEELENCLQHQQLELRYQDASKNARKILSSASHCLHWGWGMNSVAFPDSLLLLSVTSMCPWVFVPWVVFWVFVPFIREELWCSGFTLLYHRMFGSEGSLKVI